jgi:hypothetical protein
MPNDSAQYDEIKRKVRKLKKHETKIRFGTLIKIPANAKLVWDELFDLHEQSNGKAKYTLSRLCEMNKDEYKSVADEFFFRVYYQFYRENGMLNTHIYDPDILAELGLPRDADYTLIKRKFHELAMKYHPDTGGDAAQFIKLMESYKKLTERSANNS